MRRELEWVSFKNIECVNRKLLVLPSSKHQPEAWVKLPWYRLMGLSLKSPESGSRNNAQKPTKYFVALPCVVLECFWWWDWDYSSYGVHNWRPWYDIVLLYHKAGCGVEAGMWNTISIGDSGIDALCSTVLASYGLLKSISLSHLTSPLSLLWPFS